MKKRTNFRWLLLGAIMFANTDCTKVVDPPDNTRITPPPPQPIPIHIDAGRDIILVLPVNETYLNGSYSYTGNSISSISWTQVSGSASFVIENRNALQTRLSNLEEGVYQFELTVTDATGSYGKDTVSITVKQSPSVTIDGNVIIYHDLQWIFPWYNAVEVEAFNILIPPGSSFKIFIQRDYDPQWKEVLPTSIVYNPDIKYEYFIETRPDGAGMYNFGSLYIFYYGGDVSDTPAVKIEYW